MVSERSRWRSLSLGDTVPTLRLFQLVKLAEQIQGKMSVCTFITILNIRMERN
jgi:hypothetical protein